MTKRLMVVATGKLFNTKLEKSVEEFSNITGYYQTLVYFLLWYHGSDIQSYKLGNITGSVSTNKDEQTEQNRKDRDVFLILLRNHLGLFSGFNLEYIKDAWNKMCEFDQLAKENCITLYETLSKDPNLDCMVIGFTNELHMEYNVAQMISVLGQEKYDQIKGQLQFVNSYEYHTGKFQELFNKAIEGESYHEILSLVEGVEFRKDEFNKIYQLIDARLNQSYAEVIAAIPTGYVQSPEATLAGDLELVRKH